MTDPSREGISSLGAGAPEVDGVTHRWIEARGLRVHVAEAGPADGDPVVLLHGWPQHWYLWRDLVPLLADRYRMVMADLRGLGWTEVTERGYEKDNLARDLLALLDALGLERVKLIGHDWGGYAGFLACLFAPERFDRFVPCNIAHPWPTANKASLLNAWRLSYQLPLVAPLLGPRLTRVPGVVSLILDRSRRGVFSDTELEAFEAPLRDPRRAAVTAKYYRAFQLHDFPRLARGYWRAYRLHVPTLMLYGTGDFAVRPANLKGYEPYADDMRLEFVEDTGHFVVDARPDVVAERAREFFEGR